MTQQLTPYGKRAAAYGAAATAVYLAMVLGSLAELEAISGLKPFDLRPMGYGPDEAQALLVSLGETGREFYVRYQLVLDTLYPALLALTLSNLFRLIGRGLGARKAVQVGVVLSWFSAGFDYAENIGIAAMLALWGDPPDALVSATSLATVAKSVSTSIAVTALLGLLLWKLLSPRRPKPPVDAKVSMQR